MGQVEWGPPFPPLQGTAVRLGRRSRAAPPGPAKSVHPCACQEPGDLSSCHPRREAAIGSQELACREGAGAAGASGRQVGGRDCDESRWERKVSQHGAELSPGEQEPAQVCRGPGLLHLEPPAASLSLSLSVTGTATPSHTVSPLCHSSQKILALEVTCL